MLNLTTKYMTKNDCYIAGRKIVPKGIMIHSTATPGVMAARWFDLWNKSYAKGELKLQACVHAFVDSKEAFQYLPWDHRGWHAGGKANDTHIGLEICEPAGHTYSGSNMVGYDAAKQEPYFRAAWNNTVELCVFLCKMFGLTEKTIIDHAEGYKQGVASNSADTGHWFPKHKENMDTFRAAVKKALTAPPAPVPIPEPAPTPTPPADPNKPSDWAKESWDWAKREGITDGTRPKDNATREQTATMLHRALEEE